MSVSNSIDWKIVSMRVTAFVDGDLSSSILESWLEEVSENAPSKVNKMPSSFTGIAKNDVGFLKVQWSDNKLDVILSSKEPQINQTIAPMSEIAPLFSQFVDQVPNIKNLAPVDRIAFGLILTCPVPSEEEGLKALSTSIVGLKLSPSVRDFLYRVNHPCKSSTDDTLLLNRLTTWSVGHVQVIQLQINQDGSQERKVLSETPTAMRFELDINTDEAVSLGAGSDKLKSLLDELKTIALDIVQNGEGMMQNKGL